jgi:hypothetical protein
MSDPTRRSLWWMFVLHGAATVAAMVHAIWNGAWLVLPLVAVHVGLLGTMAEDLQYGPRGRP